MRLRRVGFAMLVGLTSYAQAQSPGGTQVRLSELQVAPDLTAGVFYDVALKYAMTGAAKIEKVCFLWSGEGPYCWSSLAVDGAAGLIRTKARTKNPNRYTLTGFVKYSVGGRTYESNRVSAPIRVR